MCVSVPLGACSIAFFSSLHHCEATCSLGAFPHTRPYLLSFLKGCGQENGISLVVKLARVLEIEAVLNPQPELALIAFGTYYKSLCSSDPRFTCLQKEDFSAFSQICVKTVFESFL